MKPAAPERDARRSDRAWSPYRRARGPLSRVIEEAHRQAEALEEHSGTRRRARREADLRTFGLSIEALLSDVAHRVLTCGQNSRVHLSLDNRDLKGTSRYRPASVGLGLKQALQLLSAPELGPWLVVHSPQVGSEHTNPESIHCRTSDNQADRKLTTYASACCEGSRPPFPPRYPRVSVAEGSEEHRPRTSCRVTEACDG